MNLRVRAYTYILAASIYIYIYYAYASLVWLRTIALRSPLLSVSPAYVTVSDVYSYEGEKKRGHVFTPRATIIVTMLEDARTKERSVPRLSRVFAL